MLDKRNMTTENLSKNHSMMLIPLKNVPKNALKCVKIQLLENIPSCCTLNDAKSTSQEITNNKMLVIVIMYITKNLDHNSGLEGDLINTREQNR